MRFFKNVVLLAVAAGLFYGAYIVLSKGPCDAPLTYRLGDFDTRFGISEADFLVDAAKAEKIWEKVAGRPLLAYAPNGNLLINLIYDTRQATVDTNKVLLNKVDATESTADSIKQQFEALKARYDSAQAEYKALVDRFETALATYNAEVEAANARGGARAPEYDRLQSEKASLEALQKQANDQMLAVNDLARQVNAGIDQYNALVKSANSAVSVINQSADKEFEQGEYISDAQGRRIDVYEFDGANKLVRLLAHEMGHALGMDHNPDSVSIMYYLNKGTGLTPSVEDVGALKAACRLK